METLTLRYKREKECKGSVRFEEQPENGQPPIMAKIYVARPFANDAKQLLVRIEKQTDSD